ncbi:rab effector MyRIP-like isoform X1 [Acipenser ruthenus]|uniref:rab effector MyRIP-like isoform X1 n=1 Tax=Acipenser ruthenus TaxID=7906 RepID=UPI002741D6CC|nr:rab effector MyRIP-like isoform X1 [Acipenser ruthenus]
MGRKLDLSSLTEDEAGHVLQVVQRDMCLRKKEEERLNEMKQELDEEGSKCTILARHNKFNDHSCMRCCSPFTFLINTKRQCLDCKFNVCKSCSSYSKKEKAWICAVCQKSRLLRTQSLEWYYSNVKSRFKRFGSSKVLKMLYRKHRTERGAFSDIGEGSINEGIVDYAESTCGSDSTFYRQSEGHSMAETLTVALRVAEEAIEEAISKAEECRDSLEKQNEAQYLRDNKEELIEELATTIVQKIIRRRKNSEMQPDSEVEWPLSRSSGLTSPTISEHSTVNSQTSRKGSYSLWRSQSAFSLTGDEPPVQPMDSNWKSTISKATWRSQEGYPSLKNDPRLSSLPSWRSMDRLDNSNPSSVLQSPDGNWIALQSTFQSRPSLLTKPKSQVFTALEKESGVISAYDELGSDTEDECDLNEFRRRPRKLSDETYYTDSQYDPEWTYAKHRPVTSPSSGQYTNTETMFSDSETSSVHSVRDSLSQIGKQQVLKRKGPDHGEALDINFNPQACGLGTVDSSEAEEPNRPCVRRSRRRRKSKPSCREHAHDRERHHTQSTAAYQIYDDSLGAGAVDEGFLPQREADALEMKLKSKLSELTANVSDNESSSGEEREQDIRLTQVPLESSCYEERQSIQEDTRKDGENALTLQHKLQFLSSVLQQKYSAVSLCNITTEVLKVINATEVLIEEATGDSDSPSKLQDKGRHGEETDTVKLQEHLTKLEENVYLTAGTVYGLEGQLDDLEECARSINSITTENQLAYLEDQVASAAAQVHRAEIQVSDIELRISALKNAGLNVTPYMRLAKQKEDTPHQPQTIDTSRQLRRKLPAPPKQGDKINPALIVTGRTFNRNSMFQSPSGQRITSERKNSAKDHTTQKPDVQSNFMY